MLKKPLLTIHETAELLRVNDATVRTWVRSGELRALKVGREWRIGEQDLEDFLNSNANREPSQGPKALQKATEDEAPTYTNGLSRLEPA